MQRIYVFGGVFLAMFLVGVVGFGHLERLSLLDAFYFSAMTITTVGYGDIHPTTPGGKLLAMVVVISGVGAFLGMVESMAEHFFSQRELSAKREKRNMIRGVLFSDVGTRLLACIAQADPQLADMSQALAVAADWDAARFAVARRLLADHPCAVDAGAIDLTALRSLLQQRADLLLRLLENPSVVEAEAFTDTLRAVFHLRDELAARPEDLDGLPDTDRNHLAGDVQRVYRLLAGQWLHYVEYLNRSYPYLFSLAVRTNPFLPQASAVVRG